MEFAAHLIVGRPLEGVADRGKDYVLRRLGAESIDGLHCLTDPLGSER